MGMPISLIFWRGRFNLGLTDISAKRVNKQFFVMRIQTWIFKNTMKINLFSKLGMLRDVLEAPGRFYQPWGSLEGGAPGNSGSLWGAACFLYIALVFNFQTPYFHTSFFSALGHAARFLSTWQGPPTTLKRNFPQPYAWPDKLELSQSIKRPLSYAPISAPLLSFMCAHALHD